MNKKINTYPIMKDIYPFFPKPTLRIGAWSLLLALFVLPGAPLWAEGLHEVAPNPTDRVMLLIGDPEYGNFATLGSPESSRLYVQLNSATEVLYLGLSREFSEAGIPAVTGPYSYRIRSVTNEAIVHGPFSMNAFLENVSSWEDASGPAILNGGVGYATDDERFVFAPGEAGLYYIEFISVDYLGFWDFTVADNGVEIPGRVYSKNWAFRTPGVDSSQPECVWDREFNGKIYSYTTDGFVSEIDFADSGMQGLSFTMAFNTRGPGTTGDIGLDRMSIANQNVPEDFAEHLVFLAPPDPLLFPDGVCGELTVAPLFTCTTEGAYCLEVNVTRPGQVEVILDINQNNQFDSLTDRRLFHGFLPGEPLTTCLAWDGLLGNGDPVDPSEIINLSVKYSQGIQHWSVFDNEFLKDGFCVNPIRPGCSTDAEMDRLYWDDRNIPEDSGTGQPKDGRDGCSCETIGCRTWDNFDPQTDDCSEIDDNLTTGYGDKTTLNTWWFANVFSVDRVDVPLIDLVITGEETICTGTTAELGFVFTSNTEITSLTWTGPNGTIASGPDAPQTINVDIPGTYTLTVTEENGCTFTSIHELSEMSCPTDLELDITVDNANSNIGSLVTFTITVTNAGPFYASDFGATTNWPNGIINVTPLTGGTLTGNMIEWNNLSLEIGESTTLAFMGVVALAFDYTVFAEVSYSAQEDPDSTPANGVDTDGDGQCADDPDDEDDGDCVAVVPPACSLDATVDMSSISCDNNNTESDPSDDTFTFLLVVNSSNGSTGWSTILNGQTINGNYGEPVLLGPLAIADGDVTLTVIDNFFGVACSEVISIAAPATCSDVCSLTITTEDSSCDDNGTSYDPTDDTFGFAFELNGANTSDSWQASDGSTGTYGTSYTYEGYPISGGAVSLTFTDSADPSCSVTHTFAAPTATCSPDCFLDGNVGQNVCNNNGTPFDPSDDTFTFTLEITGYNVNGSTWAANDPNLSIGPYGAMVTMGPYPISGGNLDFIVIDPGNPDCNLPVSIVPPSPCSEVCALTVQESLIQCNDNGTPSEVADDTYTVLVRVTASNASDSWTSSNGQSAAYGEFFNLGPFLIADGDAVVTFTDSEVPECEITTTFTAPPACSTACLINDVAVTNVLCNDNGTPTDPSDDTFTFTGTVSGTNLGTSWQASDGSTGAYYTAMTFGPYAIADGDLNLTFADNLNSDCTFDLNVEAPVTCSDECAMTVTISNYQCLDNDTPTDPSDDLFTFDLLAETVNNNGAGWIQPSGNNGSYGITYPQGPFAIAAGAFNYVIQDVNDSSCTGSAIITPPATCSNECTLIINVNTVDCDDANTPDEPNDDLFYYTIEVTGINTSGTWIASDGTTGSYGELVQSVAHSYNEGTITITITDSEFGCEESVDINPPLPALICPPDTDQRVINRNVQILQGQLDTSDLLINTAPCFLELGTTPILLGDRLMEPVDVTNPVVDTMDGVFSFYFFSDIELDILLEDYGDVDGAGMLFDGNYLGYTDPCCFNVSQPDKLDPDENMLTINPMIDTTGFFQTDMHLVNYFQQSLKPGQEYSLVTTTYGVEATGNYAWVIVSDRPAPLEVNSEEVTSEFLTDQVIVEDLTYLHLIWAQGNPFSLDGLGHPIVEPSCGLDSLYFLDSLERDGNCVDAYIYRTFVLETGGQVDSCDQLLTFRRPNFSDLVLPPATVTFQCGDDYEVNLNGYPHPNDTGYPLISSGVGYDTLFDQTTYFNLGTSYKDIPQSDTTGLELNLRREWSFTDICSGDTLYIIPQQIKVGQFGPPRLVCPIGGDGCTCPDEFVLVYDVDPLDCTATVDIPLAELVGFCDESRIEDWTIFTEVIRVVDDELIDTIPFEGARTITNLERGLYLLHYTAEDMLTGEVIERSCEMQIADLQAPTAICSSSLTVSLGEDGIPDLLYPDQLDLGSYDNCSTTNLLLRRFYNEGTEDCNGDLAGTFGEWTTALEFTCCDAGATFPVELQVMDAESNFNFCSVEVSVVDDTAPQLTGLATMELTCSAIPEGFDPTDALQRSELFGMPELLDNCAAEITELSPEISWDDCELGSIRRRFVATDAAGNTTEGVYEQMITVEPDNSYGIRFPQDETTSCLGELPTLDFVNGGCGDFTITYEEEELDPVGEECLRLERTYLIVNNCEYDGTSTPTVINRDENCTAAAGSEDVWVVVSNGNAFADADSEASNQFPPAGQGCATNPPGYWRDLPNVGAWQYTQIIEVMDDTAPLVSYTTPGTFCTVDNSCTAPVSIMLEVAELCLPERLEAELFLDENNDGTIDLELTQTLTRTNNSFLIAGNFPIGEHAFVFGASDGCSNQVVERIEFTVVDCYIATPVCEVALEVQLAPVIPATDLDGDGILDEAAVFLSAALLAEMAEMDCSGDYAYSVNKPGEPVDFTTDNLILTCEDRYQAARELVVRDQAYNPYAEQPDGSTGGPNYSRCTIIISVQDELEACSTCAQNELEIEGVIRTRSEQPLSGVEVELIIDDVLDENTFTVEDGKFEFSDLAFSTNYEVRPFKNDDTRNGVTTLDLILLQRHLLLLQEITDPYVLLAADITNDGEVTTLDLLWMQQLLLDRIEVFPANTSWRFIPAGFPLTDIAAEIPDSYRYFNLLTCQFGQDFIGIKIGDLNGSASSEGGILAQQSNRNDALWQLTAPDYDLRAGDLYRIPIRAKDLDRLSGLEVALKLNTEVLQVLEIEEGQMKANQMNNALMERGLLRGIWLANNSTVAASEPLFTLVVEAKAEAKLATALAVSSSIPSTAYDHALAEYHLQLQFSDYGQEAVLLKNQPDPFRENTQINFYLPKAGNYLLEITDTNGKVLQQYQEFAKAGQQQVNINGQTLPAGVLFYTLTFDGRQISRRMVKM